MKINRFVQVCGFLLTSFGVQAADLSVLNKPGTALLIRHALAPGVGDPAGFLLEDCNSQRNLSEQGREQAQNIGKQLQAAGFDTAFIYSSRWCRSLETATSLELGEVIALPALDSFFQSPDASRKATQTEQWRAHLLETRQQTPRIYITHQVNLSALMGGFAQSGEGIVVRVNMAGDIEKIADFP